jgi:hypothetical protein
VSDFSLACEESCDVNDTAQVALLCNTEISVGLRMSWLNYYHSGDKLTKENTALAITECLEGGGKNSNITIVATDGTPNMKGQHKDSIPNYCHRQYHNYLSRSNYHALDTTQLVGAGLHWTQWLLDCHSLTSVGLLWTLGRTYRKRVTVRIVVGFA